MVSLPKLPPVVGKVISLVILVLALAMFGTMMHLSEHRKGCDVTESSKTWQGRLTNTIALIGVVVFSVLVAYRLYSLMPVSIVGSAYGLLIVGTILSILLVFVFAVVVDHTKKCGGAPDKKKDGLGYTIWILDIVMLSAASLVLLLSIIDIISIFWGGPYITRVLSSAVEGIANAKKAMGSGSSMTSFNNPLFSKL